MAGFFKRLFGSSKTAQSPTPDPAQSPASASAAASALETTVLETSALTAHMDGTVIELAKVSDPTFSSGALGPGAAIEPTTGQVVAPADGEITLAFPTGHAFGIRTTEGLEVLIHVGFDTVELDGKFFEPKVKKGEKVTRGQVLVEFNLDQVKAAGYTATTPLVITNAKNSVTGLTITKALSDVAAGTDFITATHPASR
ncbi:MAG: PTS glucose transporter subunit IIA [Rothia sp. (in: high G+C Gram-positive bacteria)]|nr:PTS glucose transporter subunit IIA [Rothia sp. (in: high G+C Gram-positive bacteria)]